MQIGLYRRFVFSSRSAAYGMSSDVTGAVDDDTANGPQNPGHYCLVPPVKYVVQCQGRIESLSACESDDSWARGHIVPEKQGVCNVSSTRSNAETFDLSVFESESATHKANLS